MTLKVIIQPTVSVTNFPVFYATEEGVSVGPAGELILVADMNLAKKPTEFRIYAPGSWREVNVSREGD